MIFLQILVGGFVALGLIHCVLYALMDQRLVFKPYIILFFLWPVFYTERTWEMIEKTWYKAKE